MTHTIVSPVGVQHVASAECAKPKLNNLLHELKYVASDWEDLGIQLEIKDGKLKQIRLNNPGDCKACLREMMRSWLSRVNPLPSWHSIVKALDRVEHEDIAQHLRVTYCNQ